jgi:hypothetical protein
MPKWRINIFGCAQCFFGRRDPPRARVYVGKWVSFAFGLQYCTVVKRHCPFYRPGERPTHFYYCIRPLTVVHSTNIYYRYTGQQVIAALMHTVYGVIIIATTITLRSALLCTRYYIYTGMRYFMLECSTCRFPTGHLQL